MPQVSNALSRFPLRRLILALVLLAAGVVLWRTWGFWRSADPLLTTPALAIESLQAKSLYFNNAARPWLISQRPDLLTKEDLDENSERSRNFTQAVLVPKLFRKLGREFHFDALLLSGDPSQYKPLLEHLVETKDWKLRYADHTSLVYRRDGSDAVWQLEDFAPVRARLEKLSSNDQASALARTAAKLVAAGQLDPARKLLDDARKLSSRNPEVSNTLAIYHMERAEWKEAFEQVQRALSADSSFLPALATKAQLLYGTRRFGEAYTISKTLIEKLPKDPGLLFYHAKIAHEAHAYKSEIDSLEKLITWAEFEGRPISGYQVYLGQAYASTGDARKAINAFMDALNDPDLPDDQKQFIKENILRIKKRSGS